MDQSPPDTSKKMGVTMLVIAWGLFFGLMIWFFDDLLGKQQNPNQNPDSFSSEAGLIEVVLLPNRRHHYIVNGAINSKQITFLLDTGATDVVIPAHLASALNLVPGYKQMATTANGIVAVYSTMLDSVEVGDIKLTNVQASINPGMKQDVVLLGMSALKQIEFTQRGDTLILRQYPQSNY